VSKTLNAGEPSSRDKRHLGPRISPARKLDGVGLRSVVSDFPVLHPASWVGIFRSAFIALPLVFYGSGINAIWKMAKEGQENCHSIMSSLTTGV
jgi:hypothetical protein